MVGEGRGSQIRVYGILFADAAAYSGAVLLLHHDQHQCGWVVGGWSRVWCWLGEGVVGGPWAAAAAAAAAAAGVLRANLNVMIIY